MKNRFFIKIPARITESIVFLFSIYYANAQTAELTLQSVVEDYAMRSSQAEIARIDYRNSMISYENMLREYLPAVAFNLNPVSFNNSLRTLQNPTDGSYSYVHDYSNNSSVGVNISQKVGFTGGTLSIGSNLNMLSEFSRDRYSFSTSPFTLGYNQKLIGGAKANRWTRQLAEKRNSKAARDFCSTIADIQTQTVDLYMNLFLDGLSRDIARRHMMISDTLVQTGKLRMENGSLLEQEYLQLKLQFSNDSYEYENQKKKYQASLNALFGYLGMPDLSRRSYKVLPPEFSLPEYIDYNDFIVIVERNSTFFTDQEIEKINDEKQFYEARLAQGMNSNISLNYGLNQYGNQFGDAYKKPSSQQSVVVGLQIPVFQWGKGKAEIRMAKNNLEISAIKREQSKVDFYNRAKDEVDNYNHNVRLMQFAEESLRMSEKNYELVVQRFNLERATIYELSSAQKESMNALKNYYSSVKNVWNGYYSLKSISLFDFEKGEDLMTIYPKEAKND